MVQSPSREKKHKNYCVCYNAEPPALHFILSIPNFSLNKIISNAKRFIAHKIIERLEATNQTERISQFASAVTAKEKSKGQKYKVFEESFDAKSIDNQKFFLQKLNYIHLNPVRGN